MAPKYTPKVAEMITRDLLPSLVAEAFEHADHPLAAVAGQLRLVDQILDRCESPIEQMVAIAFMARWSVNNLAEEHDGPVAERWTGSALLSLAQQTPASSYRLDFTVEAYGTDTSCRVAIECDGHDYHERTKEQAERDKSRDRKLAADGWRVLRFTGREIYRDPMKVVDEVDAVIASIFKAGA